MNPFTRLFKFVANIAVLLYGVSTPQAIRQRRQEASVARQSRNTGNGDRELLPLPSNLQPNLPAQNENHQKR
jgi:hypothetical protein